MYILKQLPEDFRVCERSTIRSQERGKYVYFKLTKKNRNTLDVILELSRIFHVPEKHIGFAGTKDKNALTQQICSILGVSRERVLGVTCKGVVLEFLGYGDAPVTLGDLKGNSFEIVVRNLDTENMRRVSGIANYFDEQRFSTKNVEIGKCIVLKKFKEAVELIDDVNCHAHLEERPADYVGALKKIPIRLLRLYVNAYQSKMWNETVSEYLRLRGRGIWEMDYSQGKLVFVENVEDFWEVEMPIVGFAGIDGVDDEEIREIINKIMKREQVTFTDFIIKQIPELTLEGEMRKIMAAVQDVVIGSFEDDELNSGKKKVRICFSLGKGSYATMVIRGMIG